MCYSNSVRFIELHRSFCIHGEVCAKILCSEKELLNLKDSKLTENFYGNKTGFVRPGHILQFCLKYISQSTQCDSLCFYSTIWSALYCVEFCGKQLTKS